MKTLPILLIILASPLALSAAPAGAKREAKPKTAPVDAEPGTAQAEQLAAAVIKGREWQDHLKAGTLDAGMKLWGYDAFAGTTPAEMQARIAKQNDVLGSLQYTGLQTDRCLVDHNSAPGPDGGSTGTYITLRWFSEYGKGVRRESLVLHEPDKGGTGLKITGLRREELPSGRRGLFELAADTGQLALLKLHGAPRERWEPWQRESSALTSNLNLKLPAIPDAPEGDKASGEKLVSFVMVQAPEVFDKAGAGPEAKAILNAFALLMLYSPGDETSTRLAVLSGSEAEKAKLPPEIWKPLIKAVSEKEKMPAVHECVQRMAAGISTHLAEEETAAAIKNAPKEILSRALVNMAAMPNYVVRAELTATDGRKSTMEASLAPGAMHLTMEGFDGRRERRHVSPKGFFISTDEGKTWQEDKDTDTSTGLCRTLQAPLDMTLKVTEKHEYSLAAAEKLDGETLYRFESAADGKPQPPTYWVLMSRGGPVIRRARISQTFGDLRTDSLMIYTRIGRDAEIPVLEEIKER